MQLEISERLTIITQKVGFSLWQLQELEGVCATYFVIVEEAFLGMGENAGNLLEEKAKKKTFGATIHKLTNAGLLKTDIESRFKKLLIERNWLVHSSRAGSRSAIYHEEKMLPLLERLENISSEALSLLKHIGILVEKHVKNYGISEEYINGESIKILEQWHSNE